MDSTNLEHTESYYNGDLMIELIIILLLCLFFGIYYRDRLKRFYYGEETRYVPIIPNQFAACRYQDRPIYSYETGGMRMVNQRYI